MHEIIRATYELIDYLDESELIKELTKYKNIVKNNKDLCSLIRKGKDTSDKYLIMDIKNRLYKNDDYKNYIKYYNELFYIVMNINRRYNKLLSDRKCIGNCSKK